MSIWFNLSRWCRAWGHGTPYFLPCPFTSSFAFFIFSLFPFLIRFDRFTYFVFSSFVHPFPFYQNSPTLFRFQAEGRRTMRRPNLSSVCL